MNTLEEQAIERWLNSTNAAHRAMSFAEYMGRDTGPYTKPVVIDPMTAYEQTLEQNGYKNRLTDGQRALDELTYRNLPEGWKYTADCNCEDCRKYRGEV